MKALLAAGDTRRACTSAHCSSTSQNVDWVLYPNTPYYNLEGGVVGTTNGAGIFAFPLANVMVPGPAVYTHAGLHDNWTSHSGHCNGFTDDSSGSSLYMGRPSYTNASPSVRQEGNHVQLIDQRAARTALQTRPSSCIPTACDCSTARASTSTHLRRWRSSTQDDQIQVEVDIG